MNEEDTNTQNGTPDEACCCDHDPAPVPATREELKAAIDLIFDLVGRYAGRVAVLAFLEDEEDDSTDQRFRATDATFASEGKNTKCFNWVGACGYMIKANECFSGNAKAIGEGCRLFLEQQDKERRRTRCNPLAALMKMAACREEDED